MRQLFDITPLGTSSAAPMHGRHLSSVLVRIGSNHILIDCGEGTQFQLSATNFKPSRLSVILISHLHGDHWYGLPGLLASLSLGGRKRRLALVGPDGLEKAIRNIPGMTEDDLSYPIDFTLTGSQTSLTLDNGIQIEWAALSHTVDCVGYRIQEPDGEGNLDVRKANALGIADFEDYQRLKKGEPVENKIGQVIEPSVVVTPGKEGRVFAYVTDTRPCDNGVRLARSADLLLHEATFMEDMRSRAESTGHSTAIDAARVASEASAKRLVLTHFSARYEDADVVVAEARTIYPKTFAAIELTPISIKAAEVKV